MTNQTPKPLPEELLPEVPEGATAEMIAGEWCLRDKWQRNVTFHPRVIGMLSQYESWLSRANQHQSRKVRAKYVRLLRERHESLLPVLREVAQQYGYALAVHGSLQRDIDLIAVPWRDDPIDADSLVSALHRVCNAVYGCTLKEPTSKPQGRRAWVILFPGFDAMYIDLSVMPRIEKQSEPHS